MHQIFTEYLSKILGGRIKWKRKGKKVARAFFFEKSRASI
jgi:hypothetical protein